MDCQQVESLLSAYALNALEASEEQEVERHLDRCPWCSSIYHSHMQVAEALARAAVVQEVPAALKTRVMGQVRGRRRAPGRRPLVATPPFLAAGLATLFLVGALVAVGFLLTNEMNDLQQDNTALTTQVADLAQEDQEVMDVLQEQRTIAYLMAFPDRLTVPLQASSRSSSAQGMVLLSSSDSTSAVVMTKGLRPLEEGQSYHVWLTNGTQSVPVGRLSVDSHGWGMLALWSGRSVSYYKKVWITAQPAEEAETVTPNGTPVLWGDIPAE